MNTYGLLPQQLETLRLWVGATTGTFGSLSMFEDQYYEAEGHKEVSSKAVNAAKDKVEKA